MPVLVIDDNADTLQLLQRYMEGTRYRIVATENPGDAMSLVEEANPQIIVLDVMMPAVDGWGILRQLRQDIATSSLPVVVCTVLPQRELAIALGASDFIRKPFPRKRFLNVLDQQVGRLELMSR
jgi:CheY-like chemotaxis protein